MFNVQHDCATAKCTDSKRTPRRQERLDLDETEPMIEHQPLDVYVVNTHSLHNAHLLRRALPRDLIAPVPFIDPKQRQAEHAKLVAKWRENPKSHTAQGQAREKKRVEEAMKGKKGKRGGEAFDRWGIQRGGRHISERRGEGRDEIDLRTQYAASVSCRHLWQRGAW